MINSRSLYLAAVVAAFAATGCGTSTVNDSEAAQKAYKDRTAPVMPPGAMKPKGGESFVGKPISIGGPGGANAPPAEASGKSKG